MKAIDSWTILDTVCPSWPCSNYLSYLSLKPDLSTKNPSQGSSRERGEKKLEGEEKMIFFSPSRDWSKKIWAFLSRNYVARSVTFLRSTTLLHAVATENLYTKRSRLHLFYFTLSITRQSRIPLACFFFSYSYFNGNFFNRFTVCLSFPCRADFLPLLGCYLYSWI